MRNAAYIVDLESSLTNQNLSTIHRKDATTITFTKVAKFSAIYWSVAVNLEKALSTFTCSKSTIEIPQQCVKSIRN